MDKLKLTCVHSHLTVLRVIEFLSVVILTCLNHARLFMFLRVVLLHS